MGTFPSARGPRLLAFHAAVLRFLTSRGRTGELIPIPTWTKLVVTCMSDPARGAVVSRQTVQDITFSMDALGLIERKKGKGVIIIDVPPETWHVDEGDRVT